MLRPVVACERTCAIQLNLWLIQGSPTVSAKCTAPAARSLRINYPLDYVTTSVRSSLCALSAAHAEDHKQTGCSVTM